MRSSGPGGQHVNTTVSAVRATHVSTGISVKVQTERSQHANKRLAVLLIARRLAQRSEEAKLEQRADRRMANGPPSGSSRRSGEGFLRGTFQTKYLIKEYVRDRAHA